MYRVNFFFHWIKTHKILSVIFLIVICVGIFFLRPKSLPLLDTVTIKRTNLIQSVSVSGSIAAKRFANLSFISSGLLTYIGAQQGSSVSVGQTIATIDQRTLQSNLQSAIDAYKNQKISFDTVNDFNGDRALSDTGLSIAARRQLETAVNTLDQAQVALTVQQIAREQSVLFSPLNGILTRADANTIGMNVTPATVFTIIDPTSLVFDMDVDEADIGKIVVNQPVKIDLDAYPGTTLNFPVSNIDFVSHTTTNGGNAFTVEVTLPAEQVGKYRVGMNGNAEIVTGEKDTVLTVPQASLIDSQYVYIQVPKGYIKKHVVLGLQNDVDVEVVSGVKEGNQVVLQPDKVLPSQIIVQKR